MKKSPLYKLIVILLAGIFALWIIKTIILGAGIGFGMSFGGNFLGHHYRGGMYMGNGFGFAYGGTIAYLFIILIKLLSVLLIIGLIGGLVIWVKNYVFTEKDKETIKSFFTGKPVNKAVCSTCGKELDADWKVCPYCGKEKTVENK